MTSLLILFACSTAPSRNFQAELTARYGEPPAASTDERVDPDDRPVEAWREACEQGDGSACLGWAARLIRDGAPPDASAKALAAGCTAQNPTSCKHLALGQRDAGEPVWADTMKQACDLGSGQACSHLAFARLEGADVPKDAKGAVAAWIRGCKNGYDKSCFEAGVAFEQGDSESDPARAANLFAKACTMGFPPACQYLSRFHIQGTGVDPDPEMAGWLACRECELQHEGARPDAGYEPGSAPVCKGLKALETLGVASESAKACPVGPG